MQDQLRATKLWLQKQFKTSGIQLDPAALEQLVEAVQDVPDPEEYVHSLLEEIESGEAGAHGHAAPLGVGGARRGGSQRQATAAVLGNPLCPSAWPLFLPRWATCHLHLPLQSPMSGW